MLKYLLPLALFIPVPAFAQYVPQECVRMTRTWVAGYTDAYGIWRPGYYRVVPVATACPYSPVPGYVPGYTPIPPVVPGPLPYYPYPRYYPTPATMCGKSTLDILGIPIIGSTNVCQ